MTNKFAILLSMFSIQKCTDISLTNFHLHAYVKGIMDAFLLSDILRFRIAEYIKSQSIKLFLPSDVIIRLPI